MTNYAIKRTFGEQAFEVSGPEKEWVETQAEALATHFTASNAGSSNKQQTAKRRFSSTAKPTKTSTKAADTAGGAVAKKLDNTAIDRLIEYVGERQKAFDKSAPNQAVIIAKFLKDILDIDEINKDDLAHVYKQVGTWKLVNHGNQLENGTERNSYFSRNGGTYKLTYAGEKFAHDTARDGEKTE